MSKLKNRESLRDDYINASYNNLITSELGLFVSNRNINSNKSNNDLDDRIPLGCYCPSPSRDEANYPHNYQENSDNQECFFDIQIPFFTLNF